MYCIVLQEGAGLGGRTGILAGGRAGSKGGRRERGVRAGGRGRKTIAAHHLVGQAKKSYPILSIWLVKQIKDVSRVGLCMQRHGKQEHASLELRTLAWYIHQPENPPVCTLHV